jgi:hypothetical protein
VTATEARAPIAGPVGAGDAVGTPLVTPSRSPHERRLLRTAFVVVAVVSAVCIHAHAMWFDEVQAWNIARASHSLSDLWSHLRYEGHPALWYLPLYALTRVSGDPRAMQVLGWCVSMVTTGVVLFRSPFPVPARLALVAGYFFAFEYSVIVRAYGLGVLLLVVALAWLGREHPAWGKATVALALLAWTSMAGAVLAGVLALVLAWRWWSSRRAAGATRAPLAMAITVGLSGAIAAVTCIPPSDFHSFSLGIPNSSSAYVDPQRFGAALGGTWRGLVPIPVGIDRWNTNVIDQFSSSVWLLALVSIALFVLVARVLRPYTTAFAVWVLGTVAYVAFSQLVVLPDRAHYAGELFLLFVAAAWLAYAPPGGGGRPVPATWKRGLPALLVVVLAAQILATLAILPSATAHPFAPDRTLAEAASAAGLGRDVVSGQDLDGGTIAGYLDRPVWSLARHAPMRVFVNDEREALGNWHLTGRKILCGAAEVASRRDHAVAVVADKPLPHAAGATSLAMRDGVELTRVEPGFAGSAPCR